MKKLFFALLAVALFPMLQTQAISEIVLPVIAKTKVVAEKTIQINLANLQQVKTKVVITSLNKENLYFTDYVKKHNGYSNRINLKNLPNGIYLMSVINKMANLKQVIKISKGKVYLSKFKE